MQKSAEFWDKTAEKYAKAPIEDMDAYAYTLERTKTYLNENDRVLELGCGTGSTALELAPHVGQIIASDVSPNMIRIAKDKDQPTGNVEFLVADVFDAKNEQGPFDAVLAHNVLHLIDEVPEAINRINGLLKPGGLFISKTFCTGGDKTSFKVRLIKAILPLMQLIGKAPFVKFMTVPDFEEMITAHGFKIIETGNYPASEPRRYIVARKM